MGKEDADWEFGPQSRFMQEAPSSLTTSGYG